jgi:hypothetical protein
LHDKNYRMKNPVFLTVTPVRINDFYPRCVVN